MCSLIWVMEAPCDVGMHVCATLRGDFPPLHHCLTKDMIRGGAEKREGAFKG